MPSFLVNLFKKNNDDPEEERLAYGKASGAMGIFFNLLLVVGKLIVGIASNSVSIIADAMNNLSDAGSSITTFVAFRLSGQKPDREHPYGHGRMEYIGGFIVSIIILMVGIELGRESFDKIFNPNETEYSAVGIAVLVGAILVKCYMAIYNFSAAKKIDSDTIKAVGIDSLVDTISTFAVIICAVIRTQTGHVIDGYVGLLISVFIFYQGICAARDFINPLLGMQPDPEYVEQIKEISLHFDENIVGIHDLMVHDYGPGRRIISLHAEVPCDKDILALHDVVDNLEKKLSKDLKCLATIHMDPVASNDPMVMELKEKVSALIKEVLPELTLHDFRIVAGDTHINVLFDLVAPFRCSMDDKELRDRIQEKVFEKLGKNYFTVIDIDRA